MIQFYFAFNFMCLVLKCQEFLEYHPEYGPLQKIFNKLQTDFYNFTKLYMLIIFMFAILGHINFGITLTEFKTIWIALVNVLKISIGVYEFGMYQDHIDKGTFIPNSKIVLLDIYIFVIASICKILILNQAIAFISSAYTSYTQNAHGIYLAKIIKSRGQ